MNFINRFLFRKPSLLETLEQTLEALETRRFQALLEFHRARAQWELLDSQVTALRSHRASLPKERK